MKNTFLIPFIFSTFLLFTHAGPVKVMPLGDSITYDDSYADHGGNSRPASVRHAYRNYLWYRLRDARYWADFVGSRVAGTAVVPHFDPQNEGYPGETSDFIANHVYGFLAHNPADIILLHIGTNDRWSLGSNGTYMEGMRSIFNEIDRFERNYHHHVKIILALIIGRQDNDFASFTNTFNANLRNLANSRIAQGDDIYIIDMQHNAGLNYHSDFRDPVHPNDRGYEKMANLWYAALRRFLPAPTYAPTAPSNLHSASTSAHTAKLTWRDNANNETGFNIYRNNILIHKTGANTTYYTLSNLLANTSYTYSVSAYNTQGESNKISTSFTTSAEPIPEKPSHISTNNITEHSITLQWNDNANNESGYLIYHGSTLIAKLPANTHTYTVSNLAPRTTYIYKIIAYNTTGNSAPTYIQFSTKDDYAWLPAIYHVI